MLKIYFLLVTFFLLLSCKKTSDITVNKKDAITTAKVKTEIESNIRIQKSKYSKKDFDFILKDREDLNWLPKGILVMKSDYLPNYNDIGNILFYTFSKSGASIWKKKMDISTEEEVNKELNRIKNLLLDDFKKEFTIYAFLIDKQYLQNTPEGMYQKETYVKNLYKYEENSKLWISVDSFAVKIKDDFLKEREWSKRKLRELIN